MGLQEDFDRLQAGEGHAQVGRVPRFGGVAPEVKLMGTRRGIAAALKGLGRSLGKFWDQEDLGTFNSRKELKLQESGWGCRSCSPSQFSARIHFPKATTANTAGARAVHNSTKNQETNPKPRYYSSGLARGAPAWLTCRSSRSPSALSRAICFSLLAVMRRTWSLRGARAISRYEGTWRSTGGHKGARGDVKESGVSSRAQPRATKHGLGGSSRWL